MATAPLFNKGDFIGLDAFCWRQFDDPNYNGTKVVFDKKAFIDKVNEIYRAQQPPLADGYAPFCKHIFIENFAGCLPGSLEVSPDTEPLLKSGYVSRRPEELGVLSRWFPKSKVHHLLKPAKYLDLILYSREQIAKENAAMKRDGSEPVINPEEPEWGLISVKAQDVPRELPMTPITMMRNTLISEGGSGVAIDRAAYGGAVEYWQKNAMIGDD